MSTDVLTETKLCTGCRKELPLSEFYRKRNGNLVSWCKRCRGIKQKKRREILKASGVKRVERRKPAPKENFTFCECGDRVYRQGLCGDCWSEKHGRMPTLEEIEAMKLKIRRANGHDPKHPLLPGLAGR